MGCKIGILKITDDVKSLLGRDLGRPCPGEGSTYSLPNCPGHLGGSLECRPYLTSPKGRDGLNSQVWIWGISQAVRNHTCYVTENNISK